MADEWRMNGGSGKVAEAFSRGDAAAGGSRMRAAAPTATQASRPSHTAPGDRVCDRSALLHQKSYPAVCSTGGKELLAVLSAGELGADDGPLLLKGLQQVGADLAHPALKGADVQGLIASWGEALQ